MEDAAACLTDAFSVCPGRARVSTSHTNSNSRSDLLSAEQPLKPAATVNEVKAAASRMADDATSSRSSSSAYASGTGSTAEVASTVAGAEETVGADTAAARACAKEAVGAKTERLATPEAAAYFGLFDGAYLLPTLTLHGREIFRDGSSTLRGHCT